MKNVFYGIKGVVTDSLGNPLDAMITIVDHDYENSEIFTDPDFGDYHRMLLPGTYDVEISSYGYETQSVEEVVVADTGATVVNVTLPQLETVLM